MAKKKRKQNACGSGGTDPILSTQTFLAAEIEVLSTQTFGALPLTDSQ
jgi:hypothetical protein